MKNHPEKVPDKSSVPELNVDYNTQLVTVDDPTPSISVLWDRAVQQAAIDTALGPTIVSRAYAMLHTAMFDAWAAYDRIAIATQLGDELQRPEVEITEANKEKAMSFAAYRVLTDLFPENVADFDELMDELGFDPNNTTTNITTAAGIGNVSAEVLLAFRREDGSNQEGDNPNGILGVPYSDISNYEPVNPPGDPIYIERWTPERVPIDAEPGAEIKIQNFLTPHWGNVTPFALESGSQFNLKAPETFLLVDGEVDLEAQTITLEEAGEVLSITRDLIGDVINPEFIEQAEDLVKISANLTDEQKLIAEFWEDASETSFPPGTWQTFGQFISARDNNTLDEDAKLFFALGNAVFDASIATWDAKTYYDYTRPVRAVRELGELGLIGEFNEDLNGFAIEAWGGSGRGTQTILATDFLTYQTPGNHPSPPFAEYTSGHSAFSAAGAEILRSFTGSDEFGGSVTFDPGKSRFELGLTPYETVTLEWDTFTEAADEAGISRIYGGIHFEDGDLEGRKLGREVGQAVWEETQFFIQGGKELESCKSSLSISKDFLFIPTNLYHNLKSKGHISAREDDLIDLSRLKNGSNQILAGTGDLKDYHHWSDRRLSNSDDNLLNSAADKGENIDVFWIGNSRSHSEINFITDFESKEDVLNLGSFRIALVEEPTFNQIGENEGIFSSDNDLATWRNIQFSDLTASSNFDFV